MKRTSLDRKKDHVRLLFPVCIAAVSLTASGATLARDFVISGGISTGYEFDDRKYDDEDADQEQQQEEAGESPADPELQQDLTETETETDNRDERYSRVRVAPLIKLTSTAPRDRAELSYSPSFWYDFEDSDNNVDHDLFGSFSRFFAERWQVTLADRYRLTDEHRYEDGPTAGTAEATEVTETEDVEAVRLSDSDTRRRYWTNDLSLGSVYNYAQDSEFSLGYSYNILKNIDTDEIRTYEDFDRHKFGAEVGHRFDPIWKLNVSGSFVRGLFDETESDDEPTDEEELEKDLNEYSAGTILQARLLEYHLYSLSYNYFGVYFDAEERNNTYIHDITLGWQWDFARDFVFGLGAGPTHVETEGQGGEWGYNANVLLTYTFERGTVSFTARRGYEVLNFTGTEEDDGLREYWTANLNLGYRLMNDLSADLFAGYRNEDQDVTTAVLVDQETTGETELITETETSELITETETLNRERYLAGGRLTYSFAEAYKLVLSYGYIRQESELRDDSFDEHRVGLTLYFETEMFKW